MDNALLVWISSHMAIVSTWIISAGAIGVVIKKYSPKIRKFIKIGREAMDIVDTLLDAVQDDKITEDEIKAIVAEVNQFKEAVK